MRRKLHSKFCGTERGSGTVLFIFCRGALASPEITFVRGRGDSSAVDHFWPDAMVAGSSSETQIQTEKRRLMKQLGRATLLFCSLLLGVLGYGQSVASAPASGRDGNFGNIGVGVKVSLLGAGAEAAVQVTH